MPAAPNRSPAGWAIAAATLMSSEACYGLPELFGGECVPIELLLVSEDLNHQRVGDLDGGAGRGLARHLPQLEQPDGDGRDKA